MSDAVNYKHFVMLTVPGEPVALARARKGENGRWYTPGKSADAEQQIGRAWLAGHCRPFEAGVPLKVELRFYFTRPKHPAHSYPARVDVDNLTKLILDSLTKACAWRDDSQVVQIDALKAYDTEGPGTDILITEADCD